MRGSRSLATLALASAAVVAAVAAPAHAQQPPAEPSYAATAGRIKGVVLDENKQPVVGAQVTIEGTRLGAVTGADGRYTIVGVPAGTYELRVQRIGQKPRALAGLAVAPGRETTQDVALETATVRLGGVVVTASRRVEKITDAPATISAVTPDVIEGTVGNTFASALKEAKGLDFIQVGMTAVAVNARGFNSAFNNRMLMVEDGRISVIPESGLPAGNLSPTAKVDLAGMEVLVGPGSALFGPDASNGVLAMRTKDPREFPGTTLEISGGSRGYRDIQGRYAGTAGSFGYKVAGQFQEADDWENYLFYNAGGSIVAPNTPGAVREDKLKNPIDWKTGVARGSGALVYYRGDSRLELNAGMSRTDAIAQTNVGRNQLRDWDYKVAQLRYTSPHWYANVYRSQSQSGKSFALNRFGGAQLTPANASLSTDSLTKLSDWPSDGRLYAAELQGNYLVPMLRNTSAIFGGQYRNDVVSSKRQWLWDRITKEDVGTYQAGVYAQATTPVARWLDVVLAGRVDNPENYDQQFSPKAGIVLKPGTDQAVRVTFNRAYKSPTILQTSFFIPDWTSIIAIFGNTGGFQTVRPTASGDSVVSTYQAMRPEVNKTWELGYKGVLGGKLFVDGTYFRSDFENFMSPLTIVGNPFAGAAATYAKPLVNPGSNIPTNAQGRIVNQAATPLTPIVLTYYNLGNARVSGVDLGLTALLADKVEARGTLSTVKIDELTVPAGSSPEATALNSPTTKWTLGVTARDVRRLTVGSTLRYVNRYYFRSGTNTGIVPTFGTVDASLSMKLPAVLGLGAGSLANVSVGNLFSCTTSGVTYKTGATPGAQPNGLIDVRDVGCGFNRKHIEMVNMPEIGTMVFVGLRISR